MTSTAIDRASTLWQDGYQWEELLAALRSEGFTKVDSIRVAIDLLRLPLSEAKRLIHQSSAWSDVRARDDEFHALSMVAVGGGLANHVARSEERSERYRGRMLRRFIYLDTSALSQYVTALEGGLTTESTKRNLRSGTGSGGVDVKIVHGAGARSHEDEETRTLSDTDEARFDRLLREAATDPEELGWIEVIDPEVDLDGVGIGAMVSWECDLYIPEIIQVLARSGDALGAISKIQNLLPMARRLGLETQGLPDADTMSAVSGFITGLEASLVVVGEDDETVWRIAGQINDQYLHGDLDGRARVVGKVSSIIGPGRWRPYMALPGSGLLSREKRRKMEREPPAPGEEDKYLAGPALMLDILAIFR